MVSTDQAHSLGEVLGVRVEPSGGTEPVRILTEERGTDSGGGHLDAMALDTLALLESTWRAAAPVLAARFPASDLNTIAPEELSVVPGIQEILGLRAVADLAESGRWKAGDSRRIRARADVLRSQFTDSLVCRAWCCSR